MASYVVSDADLASVANAIRTKGGTSAQLAFPAGFVSAIGDIETGGGGTPIVVPSGYTQLEYIENDGAAYIDTGIPWDTGMRLELDYEIAGTSQNNYWHTLGSNKCFVQAAGNVTSLQGDSTVRYNSAGIKSSVPLPRQYRSKYVIEETRILVLVDPYSFIISSASGTAESGGSNIYIFCRAKASGDPEYFIKNMRLYGFKAYTNDVLTLDLVPAMRDSDSVLGVYDTVSGTFLTNPNSSGAFTGGALT